MNTTTAMLIGGAVNGAILAGLAMAAPRLTKKLLFAVLVFAAAMYVVFAAGELSPAWIAVEILGIGIYASLGWRGVNGSAWWLVAGWVAHPLWDVPLHYFGAGRHFAPETYTIPCLTYDLAVAALLAVWHVRGRQANSTVSFASLSTK